MRLQAACAAGLARAESFAIAAVDSCWSQAVLLKLKSGTEEKRVTRRRGVLPPAVPHAWAREIISVTRC
jgi:hypothetical protein